MRQAIQTRYLGPANTRGARVAAFAEAGRITLSWDNRLNAEQNHVAAAREFARRYGWAGAWFGGALARRDHAFVCAETSDKVGTLAPDFILAHPTDDWSSVQPVETAVTRAIDERTGA